MKHSGMWVVALPYRSFFFGAAWFAAVHMLVWLLVLRAVHGHVSGNPFLWHGYEMIFGFAGAVVTGFLLTASANWTGQRTVAPTILGLLFVGWLVARISGLAGGYSLLTLLGDGIVLWGLVLALSRVLVLAGNRRNYRFIPIVALFALAGTLFQLAALGVLPDWRYPLLHAAADLLLILMVIMGGRVIPFFTQRRLPQIHATDPEGLAFGSAVLVVAAVGASWLLPAHVAAMLFWFAACFLLARLVHWSPRHTISEPMLWILHAGYFWLAVGLFLRGGALAWGWMPVSTALHAVLVGGLGCLTLGMMARVALGHAGRAIAAPRWLIPAFVLVAVAPIPRLLTAWPELVDPQLGFLLSGSAWAAAFLIYGCGYMPVLLWGARTESAAP